MDSFFLVAVFAIVSNDAAFGCDHCYVTVCIVLYQPHCHCVIYFCLICSQCYVFYYYNNNGFSLSSITLLYADSVYGLWVGEL